VRVVEGGRELITRYAGHVIAALDPRIVTGSVMRASVKLPLRLIFKSSLARAVVSNSTPRFSALPMLSLMSNVQVGRMMSVWMLFQRMSNNDPETDSRSESGRLLAPSS